MSGVPNAENLVPNFGQLVVHSLAVAGGALVAGLLGGWLMQLLARATTTRRVPRPALNLVRVLGAIVGGILVYLFVFGSGAGGYGLGGGGWGFGGKGGAGEQTGKGDSVTPTTVPTMPTTAAASPTDRQQILRIEMLGGKRYRGDERFYLVDDRKEPRTLFEVRQAIEERKRQAPPLKEMEIVILPEGSVAREHPAVVRLIELARDLGLGVKVSTPGGDTP
jgi:hypothetical protein